MRHTKRGICQTFGYPGTRTRRVTGLWSPPKFAGFKPNPSLSRVLLDLVDLAGYPGFDHPGYTSTPHHPTVRHHTVWVMYRSRYQGTVEGGVDVMVGLSLSMCPGMVIITALHLSSDNAQIYYVRRLRHPDGVELL